MKKLNKLILATVSALGLIFSVSICASAAQIDTLSVIDSTIYASISGEDATLFVAEYTGGVLSDVFFGESQDGNVELPIGDGVEYRVFLWDKDSLAPVSRPYTLTDGRAYAEGNTTPVAEFEFSTYTFDQDGGVSVVSSISETEITVFENGVLVTYPLASSVEVVGISDKFADVVPGSVVLLGMTKAGTCKAVELLASVGIPVAEKTFEDSFGSYIPSDGSEKYLNLVTEMFSKSNGKLTAFSVDENGKVTSVNEKGEVVSETTAYYFEAGHNICYRVGIAFDPVTSTPIISCTGKPVDTYPSIFENTAKYHNYLYLRYNTESGKLVGCVYYCVPKNFNPGKGDGEYSDIFSVEPIVIIE